MSRISALVIIYLFAPLANHALQVTPQKDIFSRQFKNNELTHIRWDLDMVPWHTVTCFNKLNSAWTVWRDLFLQVTNINAPYRQKLVESVPAPWLNPGLRELIFERDKLKKYCLRTKNGSPVQSNRLQSSGFPLLKRISLGVGLFPSTCPLVRLVPMK